jgi:16S rRNA processing protein RimM
MAAETHTGTPVNNVTGSLSGQSEPELLVVGKLRRPHGFRGEIIMDLFTDFPERLKKNKKVFVGESHEAMFIEKTRNINNGLLIKFIGVQDENDAGLFRNKYLYVEQDGLPALENGVYYFHQLIGLDVVDEINTFLGTVEEILETGANNVYVVKQADGGELLLPAIESVILEIDLEKKHIRVRPPIY